MCVKIDGGGDVLDIYVPPPISEVENMVRSAVGDEESAALRIICTEIQAPLLEA